MADRKDARLMERIQQRRFDDPEVRATLDELPIETVEHRLGTPRIQVIYAEPAGYWNHGDGRPALASEDPAVMEAIGRCASARVVSDLGPVSLSPAAIHPETCSWCDYPLEQLLAACDWSVWYSRLVLAELRIWTGSGRYIREARANVYEQPAWRDYWRLPPKERKRRVEQAVSA